jgi:hypothetical protein
MEDRDTGRNPEKKDVLRKRSARNLRQAAAIQERFHANGK